MSEDWRNELITKGAAFDALTEVESHYEFEDGHDHLMRWAKTKIFALPAQPERPKGKWVWNENGMDWGLGAWCCSECGHKPETWWESDKRNNPLRCAGSRFCGNCGADMRGEEDASSR